jgi:hypothetical protein
MIFWIVTPDIVLWVHTDITGEYVASIFRVHVSRFRNRLGYTGELQ